MITVCREAWQSCPGCDLMVSGDLFLLLMSQQIGIVIHDTADSCRPVAGSMPSSATEA